MFFCSAVPKKVFASTDSNKLMYLEKLLPQNGEVFVPNVAQTYVLPAETPKEDFTKYISCFRSLWEIFFNYGDNTNATVL